MNINKQALHALAYQGSPLDLTVSADAGDQNAFTVTNKDGRAFKVNQKFDDHNINQLRSHLSFYPAPVTINGESIPTFPFPNVAQLQVTTYLSEDGQAYKREYPDFSDAPTVPGNACIAGVVCTMWLPNEHHLSYTYYSPTDRGNDYWRLAKKITATPVFFIDSDEIAHLSEKHNSITLDKDSPITQTVQQRAERQLRQTLTHANLPPKHHGHTGHYVLGTNCLTPYDESAPITITGTPVFFNEQLDNGVVVSAAETLYKHNQPYVPIHQPFPPEQDNPAPVTKAVFITTPEAPEPTWAMSKADDITLRLSVRSAEDQPQTTVDVPAGFSITTRYNDIQVTYVPGRTTQEDLADAMVRSHWNNDEYSSWDDLKEALNAVETRMYRLVKASMEGPAEMFHEHLQNYADDFHSETPNPPHPVSVTSRTGNLTVTYNPS